VYRDLDINVVAHQDGLVELHSAGLDASSWHDPANLRGARNVMQLPRVGRGEYVSWSADFGLRQQELGRALYAGDIAYELERMLRDDPGVRICLHVADAFTASLPWECARIDDEVSAYPISLDARACVVRRHDAPAKRARPRESTTAVVAYAADPCGPCARRKDDTAHQGACWERLDGAEREAKAIAESLSKLLGQENVLCMPATRQRLTGACAEPLAVFVFVGHGGFPGRDTGGPVAEACLVLDGIDGPDYLNRVDLAALVGGADVVALSTCFGGYEDEHHAGLRSGLVEAGVPVIVGMNGPIESQQSAIFFTGFFARLAGGMSIEQALSASRHDLSRRASVPLWGHPVVSLGQALPQFLEGREALERTLDVRLSMGEVTSGPAAGRWTWIALEDRTERAACRTAAGVDLRPDPEVAAGLQQVAVSADGLVLASVIDARLEVAWVNRHSGEIKRWAPLPLPDACSSARVLAVGPRADLGALVVVADEGATWMVEAVPHRVTSVEQIAAESCDGAALVRGTPWLLHDGRLTGTGPRWSAPSSGIRDVDVAGSVGQETVALLVLNEQRPVVQLVHAPLGKPTQLDSWPAPAKATSLQFVRDVRAGHAPSSLIVEGIGSPLTWTPPPSRSADGRQGAARGS
jgi:hypothetical protein